MFQGILWERPTRCAGGLAISPVAHRFVSRDAPKRKIFRMVRHKLMLSREWQTPKLLPTARSRAGAQLRLERPIRRQHLWKQRVPPREQLIWHRVSSPGLEITAVRVSY
jgi:hypothetical protein